MLPKRVVNQSILADQKYPNTTEITLLNPELVIFLLRQICCFLEIIFEQLSTKLMLMMISAVSPSWRKRLNDFGKKITSCNVVVLAFGSRSFRLHSSVTHSGVRIQRFPPKLSSTFVSDGLGERTNCSMPPAHVANLSSAGIAASNHFSLLKIVTRLILVNK